MGSNGLSHMYIYIDIQCIYIYTYVITIDNPFEPINHLNIADDFPKPSGGGQFAEGIGAVAAPQGRRARAASLPCEKLGKTMGKPWENHGKSRGKPWDFDDLNGICERSLLGT